MKGDGKKVRRVKRWLVEQRHLTSDEVSTRNKGKGKGKGKGKERAGSESDEDESDEDEDESPLVTPEGTTSAKPRHNEKLDWKAGSTAQLLMARHHLEEQLGYM